MTRSLLIRGFPRSMTSLTYNVLFNALGHQLKEPDPATRRSDLPINGEVLARSMVIPRIENGAMSPSTFEVALPALKLHEGGYLIKDVLQPQIVNWYLERHHYSYKTLFIRRNLADILFRLKSHGWFAPVRSVCPIREGNDCKGACSGCSLWGISPDEALARGIVEWNRRFFQPWSRHDAVLEWDRLTQEPNYLFDEVEKLGYEPMRYNWMSGGFENKRRVVMAYRLDPVWKQGQELIEAIEGEE